MKRLNENVLKTSLIAATFVIAGVLGLLANPAWLLLLVIPLFGIPLLREVGVLRDADERETWDHYRGSHLAFYAIMIYALYGFFQAWFAGNILLRYESVIIISIAIAVKLFSGLASVIEKRQAAIIISSIYGVIWLTISIFGFHGFAGVASASLGGLLVLALAAVGWFAPLLGGPALVATSVFFMFYPLNVFDQRMTSFEAMIPYIIMVVLTPAIAGLMLITEGLQGRVAKTESNAGEAVK